MATPADLDASTVTTRTLAPPPTNLRRDADW